MLKALLRRAEGLCLPDVDTAGPIKDSCLSAGGWRVSRPSIETVSQFDFGIKWQERDREVKGCSFEKCVLVHLVFWCMD